MKFHNLSKLTPRHYKKLLRRPTDENAIVATEAKEICREVKTRGEGALREYSQRFDGSVPVRLGRETFEKACTQIPTSTHRALKEAAKNIRTFHRTQRQRPKKVRTTRGVVCWRETRPIDCVGLYVPGGSAPLPSTALMLGIPAVLAGCARIVMCTPPSKDGIPHPAILAAASIVGIQEVYTVGGAQAVAAMAYGTDTIPRVEKIFGPGNRYVTEAKRVVAGDPDGAAIDLLAGPSELLVIADGEASSSFVASDLLSQAEHGADSHVVLATTSRSLAKEVIRQIDGLCENLPRHSVARLALERSFVLLTPSLDSALRFANDYAPEHLSIQVRRPDGIIQHVRNAGSVFLGGFSPVTAGDYASGTNHTLPTGGTARAFSGVSLDSFMKTITFQALSKSGLKKLAPTLRALARAEGLEGHARAVDVRL